MKWRGVDAWKEALMEGDGGHGEDMVVTAMDGGRLGRWRCSDHAKDCRRRLGGLAAAIGKKKKIRSKVWIRAITKRL